MKEFSDALGAIGIACVVCIVIWHFISCVGNPLILKTVYSSHLVTFANSILLIAIFLKLRKKG